MHKVIEDHPDWQALQNQRRQVSLAADLHAKRTAAEQAEYRRLLAAHIHDREAALGAGEAPPPAPPPPTMDPADTAYFVSQFQQCDMRERQWLAAVAPQLERRLLDHETELLAKAAQLASHLRALATEVQALCDTTSKVRAAADDHRPVHRRAVTSGDLLAAVESGRRFLTNVMPHPSLTVLSQTFQGEDDDEEAAGFEARPTSDEGMVTTAPRRRVRR